MGAPAKCVNTQQQVTPKHLAANNKNNGKVSAYVEVGQKQATRVANHLQPLEKVDLIKDPVQSGSNKEKPEDKRGSLNVPPELKCPQTVCHRQ